MSKCILNKAIVPDLASGGTPRVIDLMRKLRKGTKNRLNVALLDAVNALFNTKNLLIVSVTKRRSGGIWTLT